MPSAIVGRTARSPRPSRMARRCLCIRNVGWARRRWCEAVLDSLPRKRFMGVYVDLWPTDSEASFAAATARAISQSVASTTARMIETAKRVVHAARSQRTRWTTKANRASASARRRPAKPIWNWRRCCRHRRPSADREKRHVAVVFDEVQRILDYESDLVERKLRSVIQHQADVCYLFLGSRKHLIQQMFLDKSRPLYRSAAHYPLGPIARRALDRFHSQPILRSQQAHRRRRDPFHLPAHSGTSVLHPTSLPRPVGKDGSRDEGHRRVDSVRAAVAILLARESFAYTTLWESLTAHQRRFLTGLALEPPGVKPFSSSFTRRYGLRSASNAQRASQSLVERDVIDPENGSFVIVDRFLRLWIRDLQSDVHQFE